MTRRNPTFKKIATKSKDKVSRKGSKEKQITLIYKDLQQVCKGINKETTKKQLKIYQLPPIRKFFLSSKQRE